MSFSTDTLSLLQIYLFLQSIFFYYQSYIFLNDNTFLTRDEIIVSLYKQTSFFFRFGLWPWIKVISIDCGNIWRCPYRNSNHSDEGYPCQRIPATVWAQYVHFCARKWKHWFSGIHRHGNGQRRHYFWPWTFDLLHFNRFLRVLCFLYL